MRFMPQLIALLSEDADQLQRDLDVKLTIDDTLVTTEDGGTFTLAAEADNQEILFPKVTNGKYLLIIVSSGEVQYRINNVASQPLSIKPNPATSPDPILPYQKQAQPGVVFMGPIGASAALTSLFLSNPSSSVAARVQIRIIGEAV
jgi:hypothetical protein